MKSLSFSILIVAYSFLLIGAAEAQGNVTYRSAELDSLKSIRLKSPQRAIRYARQVLNELLDKWTSLRFVDNNERMKSID